MNIITAHIPLTCGELIQGTLNGTPVLVSAPITMRSTIELEGSHGLELPFDAIKMGQALRAVEAAKIRVTVQRGARCSAGYATSTADIVGALAAYGVWRGEPFSAIELAHHAVRVEPSDGTMFSGLALFAGRDASIIEPLGMPPPLPLVILDPGGGLDTVCWTSVLPRLSLDESTARALRTLRHGLASGDVAAIGEAASLSALAYQPILPSTLVEQALNLLPTMGALGVVRAHSGPIIGLLFAHEREAHEAWPILAKAFPTCKITLTTLTTGGVYIKESIKDNEQNNEP